MPLGFRGNYRLCFGIRQCIFVKDNPNFQLGLVRSVGVIRIPVLREQFPEERLVVGAQIRAARVAVTSKPKLQSAHILFAVCQALVGKLDGKRAVFALFQRLIHKIAFVVCVVQNIAIIYDMRNRNRLR